VDTAIAVALVVTIAFSLALGWRAGLLHLAAIGCGWLYNAGLKGTWLSALPYALAFGALPGIATLARPDHPAPAAWAVAAGALFGVAANLTNALPDLAADRATGVVGLPHRLGARATLVAAVGLLIAATACAAFGSPGPVRTLGWIAFGVSVAVGVIGAAEVWERPASRVPFYGIIGVVGLDLVLIVVAAHHLH
jgi:4-hydroxybenzoate polyprenyltransferase